MDDVGVVHARDRLADLVRQPERRLAVLRVCTASTGVREADKYPHMTAAVDSYRSGRPAAGTP
jgi:hypothetical protein